VISKPLRILHIVKHLTAGGTESQLLELLRRYDSKWFSPLVCSIKGKGQIGSEIEHAGIELICLNRPEGGFDWVAIMELYKLIKERDITIVRTHSFKPNLYGAIAARMADVPCVVASVHNVYEKARDRKIGRRMINRCLFHSVDQIVAVSCAVQNDIVKYDGVQSSKVKVIYNGLNFDRFKPLDGGRMRAELGLPEEIPVIGTVGKFHRQKGQKYLLEAVSLLKIKFPALRLIWAGDGKLRNELESYTAALGIEENVLFLGVRKDIPELLSAMDVFVFPSLWEGLPNALLEAMAAGKPVIASDIPPIREIIQSKDEGLLVPPQDSTALSEAIRHLLVEDQALREAMGKAARERAKVFSINSTVETYSRLFEEILMRKVSAMH